MSSCLGVVALYYVGRLERPLLTPFQRLIRWVDERKILRSNRVTVTTRTSILYLQQPFGTSRVRPTSSFPFSISQLVTPHSVELSSTSPVFIAIVMSAYGKFTMH